MYESRFVENPKKLDVTNVKTTLRYLNGSTRYLNGSTRYLNGSTSGGIKYVSGADTELLEAFCDSDFAGYEDTRRSTSGYVIMFCGGPIAWCSRRQSVVSLSSTEAEFITAAECTKELVYLKCLLSEILNAQVKVRLNVDNQSAIKLIKNGVFNKRSTLKCAINSLVK
ncbi:S2P [Trypoxylus dichotomus]